MKVNKTIAFLTAAVLSAAALPLSAVSVSAENAYAPGDVDMDGVVTGHDAAMVSRYLYVDPELLSSTQKDLADVNGDGTIDQTDADWIHENQVFCLGDLYKTGVDDQINTIMAYYTMVYIAKFGADTGFEVRAEEIPDVYPELNKFAYKKIAPEDMTEKQKTWYETNLANGYTYIDYNTVEENYPTLWRLRNIKDMDYISELDYNLLDVDANGELNIFDAYIMLVSSAAKGCFMISTMYFAENRYDMSTELTREFLKEVESSGGYIGGDGTDAIRNENNENKDE